MRSVPRLVSTIVIVATIGFVWARFGLPRTTTAPPALARQASVANFRIDYPSAWTLIPARPVSRVPLGDEVELTSTMAPSATLVIGTGHPPDPTLLPRRLISVLSPPPTPQVVRLGSLDYLRFLDLTPRGRGVTESIYVLATTHGTITGVCSASAASVRFTSGCERVLSSIQVMAGAPLSLGVDTGYALALNPILNALNAARRVDGPGLQSADVATRVRAATALSHAATAAASAADAISTTGTSAANPALVSAFTLNAGAYRDLARAASRQDHAAYGRALVSITGAGRGLTAAYALLRRFGYTVG